MSGDGKKRKRMTDLQTAQFAHLYRIHECLWNVYLTEYRNRDAREAAYQQLVAEMGIDNFSKAEVTAKVRSLRASYKSELEKIEKSKKDYGPNDMIYKPKSLWFEDLKHIMDTINSKAKEGWDEETDQLARQDWPQPMSIDGSSYEDESMSLSSGLSPLWQAAAKDECDIMGMKIASKLRKLPEDTRNWANAQIHEFLMDINK